MSIVADFLEDAWADLRRFQLRAAYAHVRDFLSRPRAPDSLRFDCLVVVYADAAGRRYLVSDSPRAAACGHLAAVLDDLRAPPETPPCPGS